MGRKRRRQQDGQDLEAWVDWTKRVTTEAKDLMKVHQIPEWSKLVRTRQEKWKTQLNNMEGEKWAKQVYDWAPIGFRRRGRPQKRWGDKEE